MRRVRLFESFTELARMTPLQYVIFLRLQRASHLLTDTSTSLSFVAESVGYQSEAAFSQAFKKQYGMRPGEFRRVHAQIAA